MKDASTDPKQQAILGAAWQSFATYGFRKTSMDDIARAAGMSRPALYLHYRNKEDIFRHLARQVYCDAADTVTQALSGPGAVQDQLLAAFVGQGGKAVETMLSSPHGLELFDSTNANARDIINEGEARLTEVYADWLARQAKAGTVTFDGSASQVAATMTAALKGMKTDVPDYATYCARVRTLAQLFGDALATAG
ncbi:TetR/AcrR family transcriptional regulator [Arenibacterium sp. CAU 1754]